MTEMSERCKRAIERFDAANREDPNREVHEGREYPKELLYAERMTRWLERLAPDASEALRLAARAQHLCRWTIPRDHYPMDRDGYHRWRTALQQFHAERSGEILRAVGYEERTVARVQSLLRKENLKADPETQALEDAACLVFLEDYFAEFALKHDEAKLLTIIRKTWKKMSPRGRQAALALPLPAAARGLVEKALAAFGKEPPANPSAP
jgi:hypothetical protein